MTKEPTKLFVKIISNLHGWYEVHKGEVDNIPDHPVVGYDILLKTKDYRDACRMYVAAQAELKTDWFCCISRVQGYNNSVISLFECTSEIKWDPEGYADE